MPDEEWRRYYLRHAIKEGATVAVVIGWVQDWQKTYAHQADAPPARVVASAPPVTSDDHPHRCYICKTIDPRELPEFVNMHRSCLMRILDPLLAAYRGETHG